MGSNSSSSPPRSRRRSAGLLQQAGIRPDRAPPLARSDAVPPGADEPDRQCRPRPPSPARQTPRSVRRSSAIALRVRDAGTAWRRALDLGAWDIPTRASAMELQHTRPFAASAISQAYFVDRHRQFLHLRRRLRRLARCRQAPAGTGRSCTISALCRRSVCDRTADWIDFYNHAVRIHAAAGGEILRRDAEGHACSKAPADKFYLQLIEPPLGARGARMGRASPCGSASARSAVSEAVRELRGARHRVRRLANRVQPSDKGALTQVYLGSVTFEIVRDHSFPG